MSVCVPTPEQREAVHRELIRDFAAEARSWRQLATTVGHDREALESEMLALVERAVTRVIREREWSLDGREARVAKSLHTELRLEIRRHFAGEDND